MKLIFLRLFAALFVLFPLMAVSQTGLLITTFTNPAAASFDNFGWCVATLDARRVLIGAPASDVGGGNSGVVYLFATNGTLLTTITNPVPKAGAAFGETISCLGSDLILIGARFGGEQGAVYLFNTNAALLTTITNPSPASILQFGCSISPLGNDRVLIGAQGYQLSITNSEAAYLYNTNGTLLVTLTNPSPGDHLFGHSVAAAFNDKLLVGAPHSDPNTINPGAVYIFNTNGNLLRTLANSIPASFDNFGWSIEKFGTDRAVVTGSLVDTNGFSHGAAYLFDSNGIVLATFASPIPVVNAQFGFSLAQVGNDRFLVGAPYDDDVRRTGAGYLFNTNASTLAIFTPPNAADYTAQYLAFGYSLAAVGSEAVLIGAPQDDTTGMDSGIGYLLRIPPPPLLIRATAPGSMTVSWPSPLSGFTLQENTNGLASPVWNDVTSGIRDDGTNVAHLIIPAGNGGFYRLLKY